MRKAEQHKARSGIGGILLREDPACGGARNQNSEKPPLWLARRVCQGKHRLDQ